MDKRCLEGKRKCYRRCPNSIIASTICKCCYIFVGYEIDHLLKKNLDFQSMMFFPSYDVSINKGKCLRFFEETKWDWEDWLVNIQWSPIPSRPPRWYDCISDSSYFFNNCLLRGWSSLKKRFFFLVWHTSEILRKFFQQDQLTRDAMFLSNVCFSLVFSERRSPIIDPNWASNFRRSPMIDHIRTSIIDQRWWWS